MTHNQSTMPEMILRPGRDKSLRRKHPWIFSGAIEKINGEPDTGGTVRVISSDGAFLAWAAFSPHSKIRARVWSFDGEEKIDARFFETRISDALIRRESYEIASCDTNAYRLVYSECDGLPGLIADRYGDVVVAQFLSAGTEFFKSAITGALVKSTGCRTVYERSDAEVRKLEGLKLAAGLLFGEQIGGTVEIVENGLKYFVDVKEGHKTGFYLDQRENRRILRGFASGKKVLNCFSYTGAFTVSALAGGAVNAVSVDSSEKALDLAKRNVDLNGLDQSKCEWVCRDVFDTLRDLAVAKKQFDLIILDPPKFAAGREQVEKAARAYKDINMQALKLLEPGGLLFTFSCSGAVGMDDFQKAVAWAAIDSGADAEILMKLSHAPDHPIALSFPESEYLKGLIIRVVRK